MLTWGVPKLIDHEERRQEIAEAVGRVIRRDGVSAVSVREVAAEAGISTGSLRHVFASKEELLVYSMQVIILRARDRIFAHLPIADPRDRALAILGEVLPLDETRRSEMEVNLALVSEAPAHPSLRKTALEAHDGLRDACVAVLTGLEDNGLFDTSRDVQAEALRLHALIDGLATHLVLGHNDSPEAASATLAAHLDGLA